MSASTYVVLTMPIMAGMGMLAVDVGFMRSTQTELQMAADAAALAGAAYLAENDQVNGGDNVTANIEGAARRLLVAHRAGGRGVAASDAVITVGDFDADGAFYASALEGDYVKVTLSGYQLMPVFGGILGQTSYDIAAMAIAGRVTSSRVECEPEMAGEWPCLMFADESLELNGSFEVGIDGAGSEVSICSNASEITINDSSVDLNDGLDIHTGPACTDEDGSTSVVDNSGSPAELPEGTDTSPLGLEVELDPVEPPSGLTAPNGVTTGNGGNAVTNFTVAEGNSYFIDGNLGTTAKAEITVTGAADGCLVSDGAGGFVTNPAILYVRGDVHLRGQGITGTVGHPECFELRVIGSRSIRLNGNSAFYGMVYAPESTVEPNGNADFHGAVVANRISATGNHHLYLDPDLSGAVPNGSSDVVCVEREITFVDLRVVQ